MTRKRFSTVVFVLAALMVAAAARGAEGKMDFSAIFANPILSGATTAFLVRDLTTGETLYSMNGREIMIPASNMKVVTGGSALLALGPNFRFETDFKIRNFNAANGTASGLYVKGFGDPSLKEEFFGSASKGMEQVAALLKEAGLKKIDGVMWVDDSFFTDNKRPDSWEAEDMRYCYAPRPGALSVGDNCLRGSVQGAGKSGRSAIVSLDPQISWEYIVNNVTTTSKGQSGVSISQDPSTGKIVLTGKVRRGKTLGIEYPVANPAMVYGEALLAAMRRVGIDAKMEIKERDNAPEGFVFFKRYVSPTLYEILGEMGRESDNFVAEQTLRTIGGQKGGSGSREKGTAVIRDIFRKHKIAGDGDLSMIDGSGLSRSNRLRPEVLLSTLSSLYNSELRDNMIGILARPGEQGTLKKRMPEAAGRLWAKTGAIKGVCSLSGYYRRTNGDMAAFVMVMNGYTVHSGKIRELQDEMVKKMLEM